MRQTIYTSLLLLLVSGCGTLGPGLSGDWEVEVVEAESCTMEMELDQSGEDIEGEADLDCTIFYTFYGENFWYQMEASNADVEGEIDRSDGDFELEVNFYDTFYEEEIVIELSGELDGDDIEGEVILFDSDWGDFEGSRD